MTRGVTRRVCVNRDVTRGCTLPSKVNKRAVCILLECFLVLENNRKVLKVELFKKKDCYMCRRFLNQEQLLFVLSKFSVIAMGLKGIAWTISFVQPSDPIPERLFVKFMPM